MAFVALTATAFIISFAAMDWPVNPIEPRLLNGPDVVQVTDHSAVIKAEMSGPSTIIGLDRPECCGVMYGTTNSYGKFSPDLVLDDLQPDTAYHYRITGTVPHISYAIFGASGGESVYVSKDHTFRTLASMTRPFAHYDPRRLPSHLTSRISKPYRVPSSLCENAFQASGAVKDGGPLPMS